MDIELKRCSARIWVDRMAMLKMRNGVVRLRFLRSSNLDGQKLFVRVMRLLMIHIFLKVKTTLIVVLTDRIMRCGILVAPHSKGEGHVPGTRIQKPIFRFPYLRRPESIALGEI